MANVFELIYSVDFSNTDSVEVVHNGNLECVGYQLIVGGEVSSELVVDAVPDSSDPKNKFTLTMTSPQSGVLQVFKPNLLFVNSLTVGNKVDVVNAVAFGVNFGVVKSTQEDSTTSTTWTLKLRLDALGLKAGTYRIGWKYEWQMANSSFNFDGRVFLDGTTVVSSQSTRPRDASSYEPTSGFDYVDLTGGDHYFDIEFRSSSAGKTASIREAILELWRVS